MDFFQRIGNFFSGKGWVSDEEKRRKEQQTQPQNKPAVTFKQDSVLNNLNKAPSFGSPSPTQGLFQQKPQTDTIPKTDTVPKVNTVPTANQFNKPVIPEIKPEIPQKTINDAPKVLTPQGQQDWVNKENKQIQTQNLVNKPIITPKKPTYFDYLNPFGEHGLFGAKQQQNFKRTIEKPITDNINKFNNWIDSSDKEKGFQWSDPGDYVRFAAKIPGGMVQGLAETPNKVANAVTGLEADENGKVKQLNGVQRFGKGLDAGISVGGLGFGGSGTLLRSLAGLGKTGTKQAVKQGIGRTVLNGTKNLVKDSLKEGAEEVTQTFAQDLADDGRINTDKNTYFQSGTFGALGGGMMHGAGRAVNGVKGMVGNRINPYGENGVGINRLSPSQMKYNAAEVVGGITGDTRKRLSQAAFGDLQKARTGNPYRTSDGMDVELSRNGNRKMTATSQKTPSEMFNVQQRLAPKIQEAIEKSKQIDSNIDTKEHGFANDGFSYNEVPVRYRGKDYVTTFDIGSNNNKNLLYNATTRKSPMEPAGTNPSTELHHLGDSHVDSVAQEAQNVNEDVKYKLNPEHEAQVRAYNEHITRLRQREEYLRGQGMSENAPAMINLRKAQEQAIYARDHIGEVDENGLKYKLSPEQETFFKDSKIRDENGNLKTVYHGTDAEFDVFNPNNTSSNKWGAGNYLAFDENAGKNYGKNVKEMYANITSPISDKQKTISFEQYDALHRRINDGEPAYREDYDMYDNDMDLLWDITDNGQWKKYAQDIKDTTGKDGVIMDDMAITFSPNQTKYTNNLNPTDNPDMRFKLGAKMQELASQNKLLARHLQLTGDENLVFNEWQNEMQKRALGYYDPKTDQINLNKLTEDTLNHELGHKLLTRVENKQDLLNSIRESYGDEYLINKYGSQYGNDLNLLAEEQLADGFSDYYNGRLNGEDKVRLGARLGIPQKVLAIYDRITEAIMGLVGKQDAIKQFYAQMETGKFRNEVFGNTEQLPVYKLDDDLSRILAHYKQSPRGGLDMNLVRQEYANNPEAIRRIDEVIAEVKQESAQNKSRVQRESAYYTKLNNIANSFQPWQPNQGLNVNAIQDFHRAEYELAKEYPDIANNQAIIDAYEKNSVLNNNTENIYHPDNQTDIDNIEAADIDPFEYTKEMVKGQKLARKGEQPTLRERWQDFKADMREKFVDRFAPIEDKIKNQSEQLEMRNAIDRTLRADGISEAFIRDNKFDKLITSFKNKKELQTFDQALIAKHALELEANGIETGRDLARDKALIKATNKRFAKEFKQVREYSDKVLQQTVDYGLISQDTANYLRKKYPDYVPFDRIFSDKEIDTQMKHGVGAGEASLSKQDIVQRIKGSSRSIDSPLNALITKTQDMIQQGERNKTAELLASYAKDPKNPFQLRELKPDESADGRPAISYLDNGKKRTFLAAPEVARAAKNMNREQMGIILRALATPARLLRMGATTVNAGFTMANVVKDFVGATVNSKGGINSMNPKSIVSALGAAFHHNGDLYAEMQREGVLGNIYELTRNASDLNLNEIRSHKNTLTRSIHNAKSPLKTLENTIGRSEDFGRALQYVANKKYAKRKGMSESEAIKFAADQARWNSTNFLRSGTYGKAINAIVPYSNANIQGQRITLRRMKENPARYTGKIALGIVAPTVAAMALSYSNDENKKIMENLPDYVKENNVVVIGPGAKYNKEQNKWEGVYLVPVPPQFSPLHRQLHNMVRSTMTGQQFDTGKAVGDAVEQVTTVNPMEIRRTGAQYVPQAVKPFVETWANKNLYTGQEVVPEGMKNLDGKDQWDNSTSLTARKVGELTGLSPKQIDNAFRTSTAGGGQNLLHGMDFAIAKATGASDDEIKGRSMLDSVVGRFYAPKGTSQSSYFYQSLEKAAKDNKLSGSDLELYQALTSRKYNGDGNVEGKTEGDVLMNNRILANKPNIVKALSEAAKWRSEQTGEELDPLYKLPVDKQQYFYHLQGSPKNGAEQRKLKQDAPWLEDFQKERSAYFKRQDFKSGKSNRVPYPEVSDELQATLKTYHDMPSSPQKWAFLDAHPELSDHYKQIEDYNNKVREAQGYAPLRTRPQQSQYVKMQMANKNWRDPAVAKYLQDLNVYNITNSASLAEMQGEELSPKALKAIQSVGKYGLVKNPDGTFALKYPDGQGTNESHIQQGAVDMSSFGRRRGGRGSSSNGIKTSTDTLKLSNATALGMNAFKKNKGGLPQFSVKAIQKSGLLKSRRPTSRVVSFR